MPVSNERKDAGKSLLGLLDSQGQKEFVLQLRRYRNRNQGVEGAQDIATLKGKSQEPPPLSYLQWLSGTLGGTAGTWIMALAGDEARTCPSWGLSLFSP